MTSYLTQTMAREHVAQLIEQAAQRRVLRGFRIARREARIAARAAARAAGKGAPTAGAGRSVRRDPYLQYLVPSAR
jgi:hypothetical protein